MAYRTTRKIAQRKLTHRLLLLRTAIALFGERGYHATTVPMIVKAARSSTGSFYYYFRSKEDVFAAALETFAETIADVLYSAIAGASARTNPLQQIRTAVEHLVLLLTGSPGEARTLIVESSGLGARLERVRRDIIDSHALFVEEVLARLASPPQTLNAALVARCCVGSVYESVHHWLELLPEQHPAPQALATTVADFTCAALAPRKRQTFQRTKNKKENHKERTADSSVPAI
jgi:TetR/AcrR family fatty acid metabolism transcriptional regulator